MAPTREVCRGCAEARLALQKLKEENRQLRLQVQSQRALSSPQPTPGATLRIEFENPQTQKPHPENDGENNPLVQRLLRETPKTEKEWSARRESVGLSEPQAVLRTFYQFTRGQLSPLEFGGKRHVTITQDSLLQSSEEFAVAIEREAERWEQLARFVALIHVSLCRVAAITRPHTVPAVDMRMNRLRSTRGKKAVGSEHSRKLRAGVQWPVHQAEMLVRKAGQRGFEYFVHSGLEIESYRKLQDNKDTWVFADKVTIPSPPAGEIQNEVCFAVPFIIKRIAGNLFSLDDINKALGSHMSQEEYDRAELALERARQRIDLSEQEREVRKRGTSDAEGNSHSTPPPENNDCSSTETGFQDEQGISPVSETECPARKKRRIDQRCGSSGQTNGSETNPTPGGPSDTLAPQFHEPDTPLSPPPDPTRSGSPSAAHAAHTQADEGVGSQEGVLADADVGVVDQDANGSGGGTDMFSIHDIAPLPPWDRDSEILEPWQDDFMFGFQ